MHRMNIMHEQSYYTKFSLGHMYMYLGSKNLIGKYIYNCALKIYGNLPSASEEVTFSNIDM